MFDAPLGMEMDVEYHPIEDDYGDLGDFDEDDSPNSDYEDNRMEEELDNEDEVSDME